MPTYQYVCTQCGQDLEVQQSFSDASLTECPACAGRLRKVFNAVGVVFKGSGFYRNDSRSGSSTDSKDGGSTDSKESKDSKDSGSKSSESTGTKDSGSKESGSTSSDSSGSKKSDSSSSTSSSKAPASTS